jgi:hypothetical protein
MAPRPRLRQVEVFPVEHDGQRFVAMRDSAGYAPSVVMLPIGAVEILARLDGAHSVDEIVAELASRHGVAPERARIEQLVAQLDAHGYVESPAFAARRAAIDDRFRQAPTRPASHAGGAYPHDAAELRRTMDAYFAPPEGAGAGSASGSERPVRGLIAPHIDFHRGGPAYTWAYRELAGGTDADLFVVFGTCHGGMEHPWALSRKDYETPFGPLRVDRDVVESVAARAGQDCFGSEIAHRVEHSIEFQAVFLQYLFAGRREIRLVPVLASFAHEALLAGRRPEDDARVPRFLEALAETIATRGRRAVFIAGADLAHIGPRFGDPRPVSPAGLDRLAREDRAMLAAVEACDAAAFFDDAARDLDARRVCGLSPIWALLRSLGAGGGTLRRYAQWPDPQGVVTFASVTF